ncbi:unnamed protein product [Moneuplotes crassus]|uniref:Uncharacterized protein n=1 Tax=Euplotes crassus TaxID=5936 RepID=A0AAD1UNW9_EUPCR|nr:unnamed protein product [Moneuplotes crassus]
MQARMLKPCSRVIDRSFRGRRIAEAARVCEDKSVCHICISWVFVDPIFYKFRMNLSNLMAELASEVGLFWLCFRVIRLEKFIYLAHQDNLIIELCCNEIEIFDRFGNISWQRIYHSFTCFSSRKLSS